MKLTTCDLCDKTIEINNNIRTEGTVLAFCSVCHSEAPTIEPADEFSINAIVGTRVSTSNPTLISNKVSPLCGAPRGIRLATLLK